METQLERKIMIEAGTDIKLEVEIFMIIFLTLIQA